MSLAARVLVMLTAVLLAFGLATLYSASSIEAMSLGQPSWHFLWRQFIGIAVHITSASLPNSDGWTDPPKRNRREP